MEEKEIEDLAALAVRLYQNDEVREELMLLFASLTEPIEKAIRMDLRDYFAAKAMQALLWNPDKALDDKEDVVLAAYEYADAMMKARDGGEDE
jgi:hypothetical protein